MRKTKSKKSKQQAQPAAVTEHEQTDAEEHDNSRSLSPICKGKVVVIYIVVTLILAFNYLSTSKSLAASPVNSNQTVQSSSIQREKENIRTGVMMRSISHDFDVLVMEVEHRKNESSRRFSHESSASMATTPNASNGKMDIVIGMAQDTDPKNLAVFCSSFREHSKPDAADAVLFVNIPVPDRHRDIAKQAAVQLIEFDIKNLSSSSASFAAKYHPSTLRWSLFYRFFSDASVRARYHRVLLIDVRDSFFQGDPFSIIPTATVPAFHAFKGVEHITIKECGWNRGWVRDCFGEDVLREIGSLNIICSGVSLGTMAVVFDYLRLMDDVVMGRKQAPISKLTKFPSCERNGVDQGVHNVLVHKQLIRDLTVWSQHDSPVVNLQARRARVTGRNVHNEKNELVPVVHQYDRYPDLQKAVFAEVQARAQSHAQAECSSRQKTNNVSTQDK
jgi:hypothetical protein